MSAQKIIESLQEGISHHRNGNLQEARKIYSTVLDQDDNNFDALYLLSMIYYQLGDYQKTLTLSSKAIQLYPQNHFPYLCRGNGLFELHQYADAIENYDKAISLQPDSADAYINRGNAYQQLHRYEAAIENYDKAIHLQPDNADIFYNRGNAYQQLHRYEAAIENYDKAIHLQPDNADAYINQGNLFGELKKYKDAIDSHQKAINLEPYRSVCYSNLGNILQQTHQYEAAIKSYDKAISLEPNNIDAYVNLGNLLRERKNYEAAIECYTKALLIDPQVEFIPGSIYYLKQSLCDWTNLITSRSHLIKEVNEKKLVFHPFDFLSAKDSPSAQKICAENYAKKTYPANNSLGVIPLHDKKQKISLGYFSADFYNHATSHLIAELIELHNKKKFELVAFSFGPNIHDESRQRLEGAFHHFIDVSGISDQEVALLSRKMGIDIAIDLKGYTQDSRPGIFSYRAAPIQVNYLGYPGTMGSHYIDYLIADHTLIPTSSQQFYTEKIAYLPNSYQANDTKRKISLNAFSKFELDLPEKGFIFCCFNNSWKITPETFDSWARIINQVEGSVLWLLESTPQIKGRLIKEVELRGISKDRLIFAKKMPLGKHLSRHHLADLFLDTLPVNAHTTASDALLTGLPVLTLRGESFAGRVSASLLNAIGLSELITITQVEYENLAIKLATSPNDLQSIKEKLSTNKSTKPLFDSSLFVKHIEQAYIEMHDRYQSSLPPEHIYIL